MSLSSIAISKLQGGALDWTQLQGKVILFVNVASKCGYTKQYAGLQKVYQDNAAKGLVVVGVPCNQFGKQEPGSASEIEGFCSTTYGVTFPLTEKVEVNGGQAHPLYQFLKAQTDGADIKWNFEKFLVDRTGKVVKRYPSGATPEQIQADILPLL